jgi:tetratricopeptide (TPR) repeat protein
MPSFTDAHYDLGQALYRKRDFDGSITELKQAVLVQPDFAAGQHELGLALQQKGFDQDAIEHLRLAAQLAPTDKWIQNDYKTLAKRLAKQAK